MIVAKELMLDAGEVWVEEVVVVAEGVDAAAGGMQRFRTKLLLPMKRFPLFARLRRHI